MTFAIATRGLKKVYKGSVEALAGVDLDVKAGFVNLLKPSRGNRKRHISCLSHAPRFHTPQQPVEPSCFVNTR